MDDATTDLIAQLCTRIGVIMENASTIALTMRAFSGDQRDIALAQL